MDQLDTSIPKRLFSVLPQSKLIKNQPCLVEVELTSQNSKKSIFIHIEGVFLLPVTSCAVTGVVDKSCASP